MQVAVLAATGTTGRLLVSALVRRGHTVVALQRLGGETVRDEALERPTWADSGLDRTLVRAPRLLDGPPTGRVEHSAHRSPRRTSITRADLATSLADLADRPDHVQQAPLVAGR